VIESKSAPTNNEARGEAAVEKSAVGKSAAGKKQPPIGRLFCIIVIIHLNFAAFCHKMTV
jgi:hypothetical protein